MNDMSTLQRPPPPQLQYTMHVILRYEIEKGLLDGSVKVEDVPKLWNDKMQQYLGAVPPSDAQGCLQVCPADLGRLRAMCSGLSRRWVQHCQGPCQHIHARRCLLGYVATVWGLRGSGGYIAALLRQGTEAGAIAAMPRRMRRSKTRLMFE